MPKTHKPPSQAKIDANRRNAKKSTGPKSSPGKARSAQNAFKHGFTASSAYSLLLPGENPDVFKFILRNNVEHYRPTTPAELATVTNIAALEYRFLRILGFEGAQLAAHAEALHPTLAADYSSIHSQRLFALTHEATTKTTRNANPAIIRYMISAVNMTRNMAHFFEKMRKLKGDPSQPCLEPDYDNLPHIAHPPLHIDQSVLPVPDIEHCSTPPQRDPDPEPEPGPEPEPTPQPQEPPIDPPPAPITDPQPEPPPQPQTAPQNPEATTETWIDTGVCDTKGNPIHLPKTAVKPGFTPPQPLGFHYKNEATKPLIDSQPVTYKPKPPSGWW